MANPKLKAEQYANLGGIDTKVSPYITGPLEFLDLQNWDFQTPGALTQRWGSTQYVGQTFAGPIVSMFEFGRLDGSSYVVISLTGGIWAGATTGNSQGVSLTSIGASYATQFNFNDVAYFSGSLHSVRDNLRYEGLNSVLLNTPGTLVISAQTQSDNTLSCVTINNYLFAADGNKFFKFDGITTRPVGLPPVVGDIVGSSINSAPGTTIMGFGASGSYAVYASFVNERGFEGQIWPLATITAGMVPAATLGGSFIMAQAAIYIPPSYGISSINVYTYCSSSSVAIGSTQIWNLNYTFVDNYPISGLTLVHGVTAMILNLGATTGSQTFLQTNAGNLPSTVTNTYFPLGFTLVSIGANYYQPIAITPYYPSYLAVCQNRLFCAGFSTTPSTVWFSDADEPEGFAIDANFEVRTNDADVITGMQAYLAALYIFKRNSFHVLTGDNPNNFFLQEVSTVYGSVNNRCIIAFDNRIAFLDRKGLIVFDGSIPQSLSTPKVQPLFDQMNYAAACTSAIMVHDKLRSQILVSFPPTGTTLNTQTLVYDYLANAWTRHAYGTTAPSSYAIIQGRNNTKKLFQGDLSGTALWFDSQFGYDNGATFTLSSKSRFLHDMGDSVQKQFRRLYLDVNTSGSTNVGAISYYSNWNATTAISGPVTLSLSAFQTRLDFGFSAKSFAFQYTAYGSTSPMKMFGFTIESRLQRRV